MDWFKIALRWLQRRKRYLVILLVLGGTSVLLLIMAHLSGSAFVQNLFVNLGAGFVGVIMTLFVLNPLFEQVRTASTQEHSKLDQDRYIARVADSRKRVRILETWTPLLNKGTSSIFFRAMTEALKNGAKIEILLLDPDSRAAEQRTDELQGVNVRKAIMENLYYLHSYLTNVLAEEKMRNGVAVRIYSGLPSVQLYQWDAKAFLSFYPIGKLSEDTPQLETFIETPWADFVQRKFEELWSNFSTRNLQQYMRLRLTVNGGEVDQSYDVNFIRLEGSYYVSNPSMLQQIFDQGTGNSTVLLDEAPLQDGGRFASCRSVLLGSEGEMLNLFRIKYGNDTYNEESMEAYSGRAYGSASPQLRRGGA
ncbi:MAG: hypothetical protein ACR2GH_17635 [Pseudonocardia sp.]